MSCKLECINKHPLPLINNEDNSFLVSIIVLNKNGIQHLKNLIPSLVKYTKNIPYELIIIDNASTDNSVNYLIDSLEKTTPHIPFQLIKNKVNESFSKANNKAVKKAQGKYIVLLNNDIEPLSGWLNYLLDSTELVDNIGSVGARLVYPYRKPARFRNPFKKYQDLSCKIQHSGIAFKNEGSQFRPYNLGKGSTINDPDVVESGKKAALTAACLLVPKAVYLEVGGLDESYHYGGEDVDFGLKLYNAGYINYYCAEAILYHHEFGTQNKEKKSKGAKRRQANLEIFQKKWFLQIKKSYWQEKIFGNSYLYAEKPLLIAIAIIEDSEKAVASKLFLQDPKWDVIFLSKKRGEWYKIPESVDILLCPHASYLLGKLPVRQKHLLSVAWIRDNVDQWHKSLQLNKYNIVLASDKYSYDSIKKNSKEYRQQPTLLLPDSSNTDIIRQILVKRFLQPSIVIKIAALSWDVTYSWGDYHMAVLLKEQLETEGYYVLLQVFPEWDNAEGQECDIALVFRGMRRYVTKSHQINIMWNISHPDRITAAEYEEYDHVFIASHFWANEMASKLSVPVDVMLQCTDLQRFHEPNEQEKLAHQQQLLFVGNSRNIYRKILQDLLPTDYDLAVYGRDWKKLIPKKYIKGEYLPNNVLYKYYGSADILLNDHWDDMREKGFVSNRIFDGLACGAFIITDKVNCMGELEQYVETYENAKELKAKISFYLTDPSKKDLKTKKGMEYIRENHTFKQRAKQIVHSIKKLNKAKPLFEGLE